MNTIVIPGLDYDPVNYSTQLEEKTNRIQSLLTRFEPKSFELFPSAKQHFRMRAEFRIWHEWNTEKTNSQCFYAMFEANQPKTPIKIVDFPIVSNPIYQLMNPLLAKINTSAVLSKKLFQMEFLSTTTGELLVTLIYHRQLDENWVQAATAVEQQFKIHVIGRARKQRLVLSQDYVTETLAINHSNILYQQYENSFTQPNAGISCSMIEWISASIKSTSNHDLLELYCGNGNFTIPLAKNFRRVLATEISKTSIRSARENCHINNVRNIEFVRLSSEETAQALDGVREFRRLKEIDIASFNFSTVLVDPPRAGLDEDSMKLLSRFDTIIYISCNPTTLADNLTQLTKTHRVGQTALFDQFPYSHHCECGVILNKK